jgi:thiamine biosynthesis lipoprotein
MKNLLFLSLVLLAGCSGTKTADKINLLGGAQGTYYSIVYFDEKGRDFKKEVDSLLVEFDKSVSLWEPNSILSRVNRGEEDVKLDSSFVQNFNISMEVANRTDGDFDFTIGELVKAWGFGYDANKTIKTRMIDSLLNISGYYKVKIEDGKVVKDIAGISFDFNAVAQGFSVDLVGDFLEQKNINNYLIDIGGEVKARGQKPDGGYWKVGIEKPADNKTDERNLKAVVKLIDKSVATSGNYRKFYEVDGIRYSHTINPKTGYPARNTLLSVSVLHNSTAYADAYATAFMVMGFEKARIFVETDDSLEAFFIYSGPDMNYATYATKGFAKIIEEEFE